MLTLSFFLSLATRFWTEEFRPVSLSGGLGRQCSLFVFLWVLRQLRMPLADRSSDWIV
jgi:hypothetical protein